MAKKYSYNQQMNIKYGHSELIDVPEIVKSCTDEWFNQTLTKVNCSVVRLGILHGEYHWHKHEKDDELFFVLEGKLFVDTEDETFELNQYQGVTIGKNEMHRTRCPEKTVILMVETAEIDPIGEEE
jgi:Mannose-6-phosphate isomerase